MAMSLAGVSADAPGRPPGSPGARSTRPSYPDHQYQADLYERAL
jgi:hypothetical protein